MYTYQTNTENELPDFGFKIHISSTISNYNFIIEKTIQILNRLQCTYKYISEYDALFHNLSIYEDPSESGKVITIYPTDRQNCIDILEILYDQLPKNLNGVYILSDRPYKDSNFIFYRYGCINLKDGNKMTLPTLTGPDGEIWVDKQRNYYDIPSWISDIQDPILFCKSHLAESYEVTDVLKYSNGGNIYKAIEKDSGLQVVLKESRPNILVTDNISKEKLRKNEYDIYYSLHPHHRNVLSEWINSYFIYDYIPGISLKSLTQRSGIYSFTNNSRSNYRKFYQFLESIHSLLECVSQYHLNNIILNDIHCDNFIVDKQNKIHFIDLEASYKEGNKCDFTIDNPIAKKEWSI